MSNGSIPDSVHSEGRPPPDDDSTELALDAIPDLLDKIERDLKVILTLQIHIISLSEVQHSILRGGLEWNSFV
jgi:hypothetical protein